MNNGCCSICRDAARKSQPPGTDIENYLVEAQSVEALRLDLMMCARMIQFPHLIAFPRQSLDEARAYRKEVSVNYALLTEKEILREFEGKGKTVPKTMMRETEVDPTNPNKTMHVYYIPWTPDVGLEWACYPKATLAFRTELEMREHLFRGEDQCKEDQGVQRF